MNYLPWILQSIFAIIMFFVAFYVKGTAKTLVEINEKLQKFITISEVQGKEIEIVNRDLETVNKRLNSHSKEIRELQKSFQSCKNCNS